MQVSEAMNYFNENKRKQEKTFAYLSYTDKVDLIQSAFERDDIITYILIQGALKSYDIAFFKLVVLEQASRKEINIYSVGTYSAGYINIYFCIFFKLTV